MDIADLLRAGRDAVIPPADAHTVPAQAPVSAPVAAPAPAPAPPADVNPYAQFVNQPTPVAASAPPADVNPYAQFVNQPQAAPAPNSVNPASPVVDSGAQGNAQSAYDAKREKLRQDVAVLVNSAGTIDQKRSAIAARLAQDGVNINDVQNFDQDLAYQAKTGGTVGVGLLPDPNNPVVTDAQAPHGADMGGGSAVGKGLADALTLGSGDELAGAAAAGVNSLGNLVGLGNGRSFEDNYHTNRDNVRSAEADAAFYHPGAHLAGELGGGLATAFVPIGGEASAARAIGEGAALGGAYGFGSSDAPDLKTELIDGAKGAALGGAIGGVAGGIGSVLRGAGGGRAVLDAADALNQRFPDSPAIQPLAGHISNGGILSSLHAMTEPSLVGGAFTGLQKASQGYSDAVANTAGRIADSVAGGTGAQPLVDAADAALSDPNGLGSFAQNMQQRANTAYGAASQAAGNTVLTTPKTIDAIDALLAKWNHVPGGVAGSDAFQNLRDELAGGQFTVQGLRDLRTSFGDSLDSNNRTLKDAAGTIWDPLSDDIYGGLRQAGQPDAARLYQSADQQYAQDLGNRKIIQSIVGTQASPKTATEVAASLSRMKSTEYGKLSSALGAIDPDVANQLRGGIINQMGQTIASRATEPNQFSLESFSTNWNKLDPQAKSAIFAPSTVTDLNNLAALTNNSRTLNRLGNPSRSAVVLNNLADFKTGAGAIANMGEIGAAALHPTVLGGLIAHAGLGALLARPGFAKFIVKAGESGNANALLTGAQRLATRNPAVANGLLHLHTVLTNPNSITLPNGGAPAPAQAGAGASMPAPVPQPAGANPFDALDGQP